MRHGSLFSGIGGFDLASEWMGWENVFHCEWNPFGQKVLKHYWPMAESFEDITKSDFTKYANTIDILTGGFPCQPYSSAGKRLGKEDERHLWPEMLRAIREISPRFVVGENVRGLTNWNGGLVFDEVCAELENLGYQVAPVVIPACGVNAPHRRERIWFVATNTMSVRLQQCENGRKMERGQKEICGQRCKSTNGIETNGQVFNVAHAHDGRLERRQIKTHNEQSIDGNTWNIFPTQSPICSGDDGISTKLDGITFSKWRNESIKGYGNAIVPQVALEIFKAIERVDNEML
jgi:DNA (cytosine-5)-methyltransferase 1